MFARRLTLPTVVPSAALAVLVGAATLSWAPRADACISGIIAQGTTVTAESQVVFISVRNDAEVTTTDVALLLSVPADVDAPFGALVPLPGPDAPVIDDTAIDAAAFTQLEAQTRPLFEDFSGGGDAGGGGLFSCGGEALAGDAVNRSLDDGGVIAAPPVAIGPVVAQWLLADDREALNTYLTDNGFQIPPGGDDVIDAFIAEGKGFLAFKRGDDVGEGSAAVTSLGVHFTVNNDLRTLPLRIAALGAPSTLPVTVFVAHDAPVSAGNPWRTLHEEDLDQAAAAADYASALDAATADDDGRLFIAETVTDTGVLGGTALSGLVDSGDVITRLSARIPQAALTNDAIFDGPEVTPVQTVDAAAIRPRTADGVFLGAVVAGLALLRRRRR